MKMVDFGSRLKALRQEAGLTQRQLAQRLRVSTSAVSYYELSDRSPSPEMLQRIAAVFHVSADYLLGLDAQSQQVLDIRGLDEEEIDLLKRMVALFKKRKGIDG